MQCSHCGQQVHTAATGKRVRYQHFRGSFTTWQNLFQDASDFASEQGPENVISISHSEDRSDGVVTVWYWG